MHRMLPLIFLLGCGSAPVHQTASESQSLPESRREAPPSGPAVAQPTTSGHRVGDMVVYEYSGAFAAVPVVLREEITAADGARLTITVTARSGDERREWVQVVTDTRENRTNNVVDELYEVVDGERVRLENEGNQDLMRLYEWTLPSCQPPAEPLPPEERTVAIGADRFRCTCDRQAMACGDAPSTMTTCECPEFLWGHGFGEVRETETGEVYWQVRVLEHERGEPREPSL